MEAIMKITNMTKKRPMRMIAVMARPLAPLSAGTVQHMHMPTKYTRNSMPPTQIMPHMPKIKPTSRGGAAMEAEKCLRGAGAL